MSCASCANTIEQAVRGVPGVAECNVNFGIDRATVRYNPQHTDVATLKKTIADTGYSAEAIDPDTPTTDTEKTAREAEQRDLIQKVIVGGIISAILVVGSLPAMLGLHLPFLPGWLHNTWLQFVLTTPVLFWCGGSFFLGAAKAFKRHAADMNTLVALGTGTAYVYSVFVTLFPEVLRDRGLVPQVYYEAAAVIITLILVGRLLENRAREKHRKPFAN